MSNVDHFIAGGFLGNSWEQWIIAVATSGALICLFWALKLFFPTRLFAALSRVDKKWEGLARTLLRKTNFLFLIILAISIGVGALDIAPRVDKAIHGIFLLFFFLQMTSWANSVIAFFVQFISGADTGRATTMAAMGFLLKLLVWVTLLLLILENYGINVTSLIAGLGIGGIAVALAVQNILGDLLASLSIVLDKPFAIGDSIQVGEEAGTVELIGLKTTRLISSTGEQLIFSNSDLLKSRIRNFRRMRERRVSFTIRILQETPLDKIEQIPMTVQKVVEAAPNVRFHRCNLANFGESLDFEVVYWVLSPDEKTHVDARHHISLQILEKFRRAGIDFSYPTRKIFTEAIT